MKKEIYGTVRFRIFPGKRSQPKTRFMVDLGHGWMRIGVRENGCEPLDVGKKMKNSTCSETAWPGKEGCKSADRGHTYRKRWPVRKRQNNWRPGLKIRAWSPWPGARGAVKDCAVKTSTYLADQGRKLRKKRSYSKR